MTSLSLLEAAAPLIEQALVEDLGHQGEVTTRATIPEEAWGEGVILAKAGGVLAGLPIAEEVFRQVEPKVRYIPKAKDGEPVAPGKVVVHLSGPLRGLLTAKRVALNSLDHLSGIATLASGYVDAVAPYKAVIFDTRKTTPSWHVLEKYAVRCGDGRDHRMWLYDIILTKDNHISAAGSLAEAGRQVRASGTHLPIEVEVKSLEELEEALALKASRVLLDHMDVLALKKAAALC